MRLCFTLLPVRTDHHDHVPPVLLGLRLDEAELFNVAGETLQQTEPQLGPRLLTSPEHDRHLDLVARLEEPLDVALLGAVVVRVDLRAELDLLDDRLRLVLARFPGLDRGLVLVLAVVHELGDRGPGSGCHLDQVEIGFLSQLKCVVDRDDPDLLSLRPDQPDLGSTDALVDTRFGADVTSLSLISAASASGGDICRPSSGILSAKPGTEPPTRENPASDALGGATTTTAPSPMVPH